MNKLTIMSGTIYTIEGIAKITRDRSQAILNRVDRGLEILESLDTENLSDVFFAKIQIDNIIVEGRIRSWKMNEFQQVSATYAATKRDGSPATIHNPRAVSDNEAVLTAELDEAAGKATFKAVRGSVTAPTAVAVRVIADADLDEEEVREISVEGSVLVTPGEAEALTLTFEEPVDQV